MRCLALAALVLLALTPRPRLVSGGPLVIPVLVLLGSALLSTLVSIDPRVSFLGSYHRLQGFGTMLAYVVLAGAVALTVQRQEQVERAVSAAIVASVPAALYGIVQHLGLDPLPWAGDAGRRVIGPAGHPAFLAAYLMMTVPLILARVVRALRQDAWPRAGAYVAMLGVDLAALWRTGSRGASLGLLAAITAFLALLWRRTEYRRLAAFGLGAAGLATIVLGLLQLPRGPLETLRSGKLARYADLLDVENGTVRGRVLIWRAAFELMTSGTPLPFVGGGEDGRHAARWLVGYGPETFRFVFPQAAPPELAGLEDPAFFTDSAHNATLDAFVTGGLLGVLAYGGLIAAVLFQALKRTEGNLTLVSLYAAIAGHLVESQFGVANVTTELLFWVFLALATGALYRGQPRMGSFGPFQTLGAGLVLATAPLLIVLSLRVVRADVAFVAGKRLADLGEFEGARALHERAITLCPWEDQYRLEWGKTLVRAAQATADTATTDRLFEEAEGALREAQRLGPRNPETASALARLQLARAALSNEPAARARHAGDAEARYEDALRLSPRDPDLWNEAAAIALDFGGDPKLASSRLQRSLALDPHRETTHLLRRQLEARLRSRAAGP